MNNVTLSNILWAAVPNEGFAIYGSVENESDYDSNVVYNDSTKKPSWATAVSYTHLTLPTILLV